MSNKRYIPKTLQLFPRKHLLLLGLLAAIVLISIIVPRPAELDRITLPIAVTEHPPLITMPASEPPAAEPDLTPDWQWKEETVRSGDSLSAIFQRVGVPASVLHTLVSSNDKARQLTRIFPGQQLRFAFNADQTLQALQYLPSQLEQVDFTRLDDGSFAVENIIKQPDIQLSYHKATIDDSLFLAGQRAGMSQGLIMQVADIFSGVIDFIYDPRKGDTFDILYEEKFLDGEKIGNGNLLAASYHTATETYTAYRYEFENGSAGYYNAEGISMRKAFLRAPLDFKRISSGFNLSRRHPVHKKIVAHRGIDYAAPTGTPVFAAGDGRVVRSGFSAANGNYIFISHGTAYMTKYLHLNQRYVKTGQSVKQRTVIGTVGSTGYSTGPHLHYEFLVNGVHRDPRTILNKLPSAEPIPKTELARFQQQIHALQLQYTHRQQLLAQE